MLYAERSFTDPPGLKYSAFPRISTPGNSLEILSKRSSGVLPIVANNGSASLRARCGIGRTNAMLPSFGFTRDHKDATTAYVCNQRDYRISELGLLYHRPNLCQESREGARSCGAGIGKL